MKDAPWVGLCKEDYYKREDELIGYCENCGSPIYCFDDYTNYDGLLLCDTCMEQLED